MLAERQNASFRDGWLTFYNTEFDQMGGNMAAEYERMRSEFASHLPDEISRGNFYRLTQPHFEQWQNQDTTTKVGFVSDQIDTTVIQSFRTANDDLKGQGVSAKDRAAAIFTMSAGNRTFLEMDGKRQNDTLFQMASIAALEGDEELVKELLRGTRVGADGAPLPALSSIASYATDSIKLLEQAGGVHDQKAQENGFPTYNEVYGLVRDGKLTEQVAATYRGTGIFDDGRLSSLVQQSTENRIAAEVRFQNEEAARVARANSQNAETGLTFDAFMELSNQNGTRRIVDQSIVSVDGKGTRIVTRAEQIKAATTMYEEAMTSQEGIWRQQGMAPEEISRQTAMQKLIWYSQNQIPNKEWEDIFNGIASRGTPELLLEGGEASAQIIEQAELYRQLNAANPAYVSTLLTDSKSRDFLDNYTRALEDRNMPEADAARYAATQVAAPGHIKVQSLLTPDVTDDIVRRTLRDLGFDERATNEGAVRQRIIDMSLNNATEGEIRDRIKTEIEDTSVEINGMLVQDHRDLPKDFPALVDMELATAFETFGQSYGLPDASDLYVVPISGQTKWEIRSKYLGGLPIGAPPITPQSLNVRRNEVQLERDTLVLQMIQAKDSERAAYQARMDAEIADMEAQIAKFRNRTGKFSNSIADYLQGVLNDRLTRDKMFLNATPEVIEQKRQELGIQLNTQALEGSGVGLGSWSPATVPPL